MAYGTKKWGPGPHVHYPAKRTAWCLHCGGALVYDKADQVWSHTDETLPFPHAACPDKINPENWR